MNKKKDLTSIEDLGEFIHDLSSEDEVSEDPFAESASEASEFQTEEIDFSSPSEEEDDKFEQVINEKEDHYSHEDTSPFELSQDSDFTIEHHQEEKSEPTITKSDFSFERQDDRDDIEQMVNETIEPPLQTANFTPKETFDDLKKFAENSSFSGMASEGNPSFSVLIKNVQYSEDVADIVTLLKELSLLADSEEQTKARLMRGMLLVPRISEYAAIFLAHKLRRFDIDIQVGLSDDIHPPKHEEKPETGITSKHNVYLNQNHHFHFDDSKLDINQIVVAATQALEGHHVVRYLGIASEHKLVDSYVVEDENSDEIPKLYKELAYKLKAHALKAHANAVVGLNYQLTPLPTEYGLSGRYRLSCTGNMVWVNKQ